ncbi:PREDICTED: protein-lysine N-methyltransferase EEF2KMT isoform X1 [Ipomoea nil]|uniref:protein-lysine N-methyltransferase EEF2KMT isoform X1 n=1 Tax=Ipomoea nil TaxID=35883 RepID=UPI0009011901|nr:PREDICTED: protein-lysine N-methyltransferase EEF2KMT isoform X1 [Ipomoea nil]
MADEDSIQELELFSPPCLHFIAAFLAMEPPDIIISFARDCGGGKILERVQRFIWEHCINRTDTKPFAPYLRSFLKKLIVEIESSGEVVIDELYEKYVYYMSLKENESVKGNARFSKTISFLFPRECWDLSSCPKSRKLEVLLHCSVNMLEGDTGCTIWPSSLFLSEFILSFPEVFTNKSCFEVGSGVGLVGICLAHIKASQVILSDGDLSTLANMRLNLESNKLTTRNDFLEHAVDSNMVQCLHLPWESAAENELLQIKPDIVLGADVIYDPLCLPHLVRVLAVLLNREGLYADGRNDRSDVCPRNQKCAKSNTCCAFDGSSGKSTRNIDHNDVYMHNGLQRWPVAYIASVIRNIDTYNCFLALAEEANLSVLDITEKMKPFNLLPYAKSYQQSSIRMLCILYLSK